MSKILIIDDDHQICNVFSKIFTRMDHMVELSFTLKEGIDKAVANNFDIVFLDVNLPDGNGLDAIEVINDQPFSPEIIIMTGDSDPEGAELAMKSKAWDYIQKSGSHKDFKFSLIRALEYRQQKRTRSQDKTIAREPIIGESRQIKLCLEQVSNASNNDVPILIVGETGTGKELFAKAIHKNSYRKENNFIVVDCAALPEHLVESVLFGHSKGAFTGANSDNTGLIKLADEGTLFLDEIGELPLGIQIKFLRALQEKRFRPVGSKKEISSNFRLVSATHRNVPEMVEQGRFREDFYFRIAPIKIEIPPLRNRKADIPLLVTYHMNRKTRRLNDIPHELSLEFIDEFHNYNWPGNVRELFNTIDYACSDAYQETILFPKHLPDYIRSFNIKHKLKKNSASAQKINPVREEKKTLLPLNDHIEHTKYEYIQDLLAVTKGDIKTCCRLSGLSRGHLYSLFKKYEMSSS